MLLSILSVIANIIFYFVLNTDLYTDRAIMPNGEIREWQRSPVSRLQISDQTGLLYLQLTLAAVSIITSVLVLFGIKSKIIKIIQRVSILASAVVFAVIMIVSSNSHAEYA